MVTLAETAQSRLAGFFADALGLPVIEARAASEFTGGGSRSTYVVEVSIDDDAGKRTESFVVKQDPLTEGSSMVPGSVIDEYRWCRAVWETDNDLLPEPVAVDETGEILGSPFFAMRLVSGNTDAAVLFGEDFTHEARQIIAREAFHALGKVAGIDVSELDHASLGVSTDEPGEPWQRQLDQWEAVHKDFYLGPLPLVSSAIRALRANPPAALKQLSVVHGDFRFGNYIYSPSGLQAVIDWEMAHLGDPHEDLAWAFMDNWRWADPDLVWGFVADENAVLEAWEQASDLTVDRHALSWWIVFNHVKAAGLWVRAAHAVKNGTTDRIGYAVLHWYLTPTEEQFLARHLERILK